MSVDRIPVRNDISQMFGRHLVALCLAVRQSSPESGSEKLTPYAFSATILGVRRWLFLLTAGHVLKQIDSDLASGKARLEYCRIAAFFGPSPETDDTFPFNYLTAPRKYVEEDGMDFGVIALSQHHQRLILANGIEPIEEVQWRNLPSSFDRYMMTGLPHEFTADHLETDGGVGLIPVVIRVHKLESRPFGMDATKVDRFYGKLPDNIPLKDIEGMSGGPIFGVVDGPPLKYWAVAIQSTWLPMSKEIAGCKIDEIGRSIDSWMETNDPGRS